MGGRSFCLPTTLDLIESVGQLKEGGARAISSFSDRRMPCTSD